MMTPRPNMIRALAAELAAGHTTSIARCCSAAPT